MVARSQDSHSFARPEQARVTHLSLDLAADFESRRLSGTAALDLALAPGAEEVVLDTEGLAIEGVADAAGRPLGFELAPRDPVLGSRLAIALPPGTGRVVIRYRTAPEAAALQWLSGAQTAGGKPFLFTQGQAILTRTWIPCQDTPGVRATWEARITVPEGVVALMSAELFDPAGAPGPRGRTFAFAMRHPVPSYLIALAAGDLAFRSFGERAGVWAERETIDAAAAELADSPRMIAAAEELYGEYRWGRYDVLILPPSFPFGGMENPCLTFATPTILAGDRSLVALIAHELAHSWSGNLVTNATWEDLWLNEGFTVYFERRIMEALHGADYVDMLRVLGWQDLQEDLRQLGGDGPDTRLHVELAGRNPDDAFSNIPYEKGALFVGRVEAAVGRVRFDAFLRDYFDRFAFQPMTAERFLDHVKSSLFRGDDGGFAALDAATWVYAPGLPGNAVAPTSARLDRVAKLRAAWLGGAPLAGLPWSEWTTHERLHFLRGLGQPLERARAQELDRTFRLSDSGNSEILFEWLRIAIRSNYEPAYPALEGFLTRQGRRKFLKPLYQDLQKTPAGLALAERIYEKARPGYHAVSANTIDDLFAKARAK